MDPDAIPSLPRGVRRHFDTVRGQDVLLAPERVLVLDQIGVAILDLVDGVRSVAQIVDALVSAFAAPRDVIAPDVADYLSDLKAKRVLDVAAR